MPDPTPTAHLTAGIEFKIGGNTIAACFSTPDFITEPERVDVTSFDDTTYKAYIAGLQDLNSLNFDFINLGTNYTAAVASASTANTSYTVTFPSGMTVTISGEHRVGPLAASVNEAEKFRIAITAKTITIA
jgi:hypothetical protein